MKNSDDRILTTHTGSMPRPPHLLELLRAKAAATPAVGNDFNRTVRESVREIVAKQVMSGVDVVSDGEMSKVSMVWPAPTSRSASGLSHTSGPKKFSATSRICSWPVRRAAPPKRS